VRSSVKNAPAAKTWRAFFVLAAVLVAAQAGRAQSKGYSPSPEYLQLGKPDQEEGRHIIAEFRQMGLAAGDFYLEFDLRVLPRRGPERVQHGQMWGSRNDQGAITRVVVKDEAGAERRLLVQNGPAPAIWSWQPGAAGTRRLGLAEQFLPVAQTDLTPFDLQMPFLFWNDFTFEGVARLRGRPAHRFLFLPPADVKAAHPALTGVRVSLDTQFHALVEIELIGEGGHPLKTVSLLELKKIQEQWIELKKVPEQWIMKTIDLRDEATRNKTRFAFTGAALGLTFAPALFEPAALADDVQPPATGRIVRFGE
jgi:hypothetical protein